MQILQVNTSWERGGAARAATKIDEAVSSHPHTSTTRAPVSEHGSNVVRLGNAFAQRAGIASDPVGIVKARKIARMAQEFDVIHLHNIHGYYVHWPTLLQNIRHLPVIWTWHDMWPSTGRCAFPSNCERWAVGCGRCPDKTAYPKTLIDSSGRYHALKRKLIAEMENLTVVCPSRWLTQVANTVNEVQNTCNIPNVVELNVPCSEQRRRIRVELGLPEPFTYVAFIAADCGDSRKNYTDFAQATSDLPCVAVAVGAPPIKSDQHVIHLGSITDPTRLHTVLADAAALVVPSLEDNYPSVVIESLICGTPVVAYPTGGIPEMIEEEAGTVVSNKSANELESALRAWLKTGARVPGDVVNKTRYIHSKETVGGRYVQLYERTIARQHAISQ